jgi:hypothetical protein
VRANPTTIDGVDIPNVADVTASDKSKCGPIILKPVVNISNTVYVGDNEKRSCATSRESVEGLFGTVTTFCFNITNLGNTHLDTFRIGNDALSFSQQANNLNLAPGAWEVITVARKIVNSTDNLAKVSARPISPIDKVTPLAMGDVSHSDTSRVVRTAHKPMVEIDNTVYVGGPGSCNRGVDTVRDIFTTDVVYCFKGKLHVSGKENQL